jgi:SP family general alpha glucoside:H+ symporter-like MFS transporter
MSKRESLEIVHGEKVQHANELHAAEERLKDAEAATRAEHNLSLLQAIKLYPKATAWSLAISLAVIMDGFDLVLLSSLC